METKKAEITIHPIKNNFTRAEVTRLVSKLLSDAKDADYYNLPSFREKADFEYEWCEKNLI